MPAGSIIGNDNNAFIQIQMRIKSVQSLIPEINNSHAKGATVITSINKIHDKARQDEKISNSNKAKLKNLYNTAINDAEAQQSLIAQALEKIYDIRTIKNERRIQAKNSGNKETIRRGALMKMLQTTAQTLPLWLGKPEEKAPPLCGAIQADSNYVAKVGDMVAALVRSPEGDENLILAEVVSYNATTGKYEVDDIDEEQKDRLSLSKRRIIPLPIYRADPELNPEALFPNSSIVMALYPQTTCFYKAVVNATPTCHNDEYEVLFEDSSYTDGFSPPLKVAQRYVIAVMDKKTTK